MTQPPKLTLNDQSQIPQLGYGVWQVADDEAEAAVNEALRAGYRSIDTAAIYENEAGVGKALRSCGLKREEIYVTTKLWNTDQAEPKRALEKSLAKLKVSYVDLYLIHWPSPHRGHYVDAWKALVAMKREGLVKAIGVSNFLPEHLSKIIEATGETPVLNQIELHPRFQQKELVAFHAKHRIHTECWSPLGQGKLLSDPTLTKIGQKHGKSAAQVILRWHMEKGYIAIPKSVTPSRIRDNINIFDFTLSDEDRRAIEGLDSKDGRVGPNPATAEF